jgi:hypothetical protein
MAKDVKVTLLTIPFPTPVEQIPGHIALALVSAGWDRVNGAVQALAGLSGTKVNAFEPTHAISDMVGIKGVKSCEFYAALGEYTIGAYWSDNKRSVRVLAEGKLPSDVEERRALLTRLHGWSHGGKKLVTDADLKQFEADFPKKPKVYKDFQAMRKDSNALVAFLDWARRKGGKPAKARDAYYDAFTGNRSLKDNDPVVVAALKALNEALKEYYKSF